MPSLEVYEPSPHEIIEKKEVLAELYELMLTLGARYERVLRLRWGFHGDEKSFRDVGNILGISRERVRQIEATAFRKLRKKMLASIMFDQHRYSYDQAMPQRHYSPKGLYRLNDAGSVEVP
jgi:DNA-directed RNA polymerase sigma subunit (sigma70/sigma32)